jgi:hypothetical protein
MQQWSSPICKFLKMLAMRELGGKYEHPEMEKNIINLPVYWDVQFKNQAMLCTQHI